MVFCFFVISAKAGIQEENKDTDSPSAGLTNRGVRIEKGGELFFA
jgi:hypothetical protein